MKNLTEAPAPTLRQLLPPNHIILLAQRCKLKSTRYLHDVISLENTDYKHWPEIESLAQETNPEGFAKWEAARAEAQAA